MVMHEYYIHVMYNVFRIQNDVKNMWVVISGYLLALSTSFSSVADGGM